MLGLKSFKTAAITFAGIELASRIRKGQFSFGRARQRKSLSLKQPWDLALTQSPQPDQSLSISCAANASDLTNQDNGEARSS